MATMGVIADDFTGATDIATAYAARGYRTEVLTAPDARADPGTDVSVVALKTRTAPIDVAVAQSLAAHDRLAAAGHTRFFLKYCSTFDSTDRGNIGPVLDALVERTGAARCVVVPAFPDNGRTTFQGHLFVWSDLLEHSSMRHHPLTPMTKSRVADILRPQTRHTVGEVRLTTVQAGPEAVRTALDASADPYVVVDAVDDDDLVTIAAATEGDVLRSGGSGLALGVAPGSADATAAFTAPVGRRLVVCGSASARTREQIASAVAAGSPTHQLDVARLAVDAPAVVQEAVAWLRAQPADSAPVVYSVGVPSDVSADADSSTRIEHALSEIVDRAIADGFAQCIVAGGETSGAVVSRLGIQRLVIGAPIAPGVCWAEGVTASGRRIAIALKSGNFGSPDMFVTAWEALA
ncbi:four-carbon acid sugar kinase family protein [Curtobacterium sp. VKM Ac-2861]|uniref:3-oxo-tetronate kinase n=1 Tax=unclassified Curtobacterium TaxID=257496 RepID=UPI001356B946|nr:MULTISPECIES: 3-oxo-tetronate kinase [unclassified Curtobacterium]NQW91197.1 four-carbon acid sugar kinase family protein [Curtobacterium sp. VKM Ac-2861]